VTLTLTVISLIIIITKTVSNTKIFINYHHRNNILINNNIAIICGNSECDQFQVSILLGVSNEIHALKFFSEEDIFKCAKLLYCLKSKLTLPCFENSKLE